VTATRVSQRTFLEQKIAVDVNSVVFKPHDAHASDGHVQQAVEVHNHTWPQRRVGDVREQAVDVHDHTSVTPITRRAD
jgi:hypothetical protein